MAICLIPGVASAAPAAVSTQDKTFMTQNAQTNLAEISLGTLALQKATTAEVRDVATMTKSDHEQAMAKLRTVAQSLNVTLPSTPNPQQLAIANSLKATSGSAFDVAYIQAQITGHQQSIANTNVELSSGSNSAVTSFARSYLPVAQKHLLHAQEAAQALGVTPTGVNTGSGGAAAAGSSTDPVNLGIGGAGVALAAVAAVAVVRRRRQTA